MEENPYLPPEVAEVAAPPAGSSEAVRIRQAHLQAEASLKGMGALFLIGAILMLFALTSTFSTAASGEGTVHAVRSSILICLVFLPLQIVAWWGLRRLRPWVKVPAGILAGLGLLGFPVGTIISLYFLFILFGAKGRTVLSPDYKAVIDQTPGMKYRTPVWNWVVLGILVLCVVAIVVWAMITI